MKDHWVIPMQIFVSLYLHVVVGDTIIVTTRSTVNSLLLHMNSQQLTNFTMEVENNNQIAFLDTLVHRDIDNHLMTTAYSRPTKNA